MQRQPRRCNGFTHVGIRAGDEKSAIFNGHKRVLALSPHGRKQGIRHNQKIKNAFKYALKY